MNTNSPDTYIFNPCLSQFQHGSPENFCGGRETSTNQCRVFESYMPILKARFRLCATMEKRMARNFLTKGRGHVISTSGLLWRSQFRFLTLSLVVLKLYIVSRRMLGYYLIFVNQISYAHFWEVKFSSANIVISYVELSVLTCQ